VFVLRFLIDGTRCRVEGPTKGVDLFWSGKHHKHGVNIQVISASDGYPLWVSDGFDALPHSQGAAESDRVGFGYGARARAEIRSGPRLRR